MPSPLWRRRLVGGGNFHDGMLADFMTGNFYTRVPGGALTRFSNAQSMFSWSSSAKWVRNAAGLLVLSAANQPAYEWSASAVALGARFEGARTNSCLWSDDLTNAAWVKTSCTAAKNATGADGVANSASTLTATGANATCLQTFTSASQTRQYSAWARRKTGSGNIQMTVDNGTTWTTVTLTASWALVSINQTAVTNPVIGWRIVTSGDEIEVQYNQLENGQTYTSSPIPTTTAAVTRNADSVLYTFGSEISLSEGTLFAQFRFSNGVSSSRNGVLQIGPAWPLYQHFGTLIRSYDSTNLSALPSATLNTSTVYRAAVSWGGAPGNQFICGNPNGSTQSATATFDGSMGVGTTLSVGVANTSDYLEGHLQRLECWSARLSDGAALAQI